MTRTAESAAPQWSVECLDPFGRYRGMTVVAGGDRVLLVSPPGESAVLSADQTRELSRTLGHAAAVNAVSASARTGQG